jgi:NAD(P)-dependent dehydrogenase (short-subunit alcohol dehydrogenase family)
LVTGASSGIGEAIALRLAEMGMTVYAAARRLDRMEHLKEKLIRVLPLDLTDEASLEACYRSKQRSVTHRQACPDAGVRSDRMRQLSAGQFPALIVLMTTVKSMKWVFNVAVATRRRFYARDRKENGTIFGAQGSRPNRICRRQSRL